MIIHVGVADKIASQTDKTIYVCGNSDFTIEFDFDAEWDSYTAKTARFIHGESFTDVVFSGNSCAVPIMQDVYSFKVGVYAGDLHTTTPAIVSAKKSILCEAGAPAEPPEDVYHQLIDMIDAGMLKGDKGDRGAPGPAGAPGSAAEVTEENITAALGYKPANPDDFAVNQGYAVTNLYPDNIQISVNQFCKSGNVCMFTYQINVKTAISGDYGLAVAQLPFASAVRMWLNNGWQFYVEQGEKNIKLNNDNLATGGYMLSGMYLTND